MLIPSERKSRPCCWPPRPRPAGLELTCRTSPAVPSLLPRQSGSALRPSRGLPAQIVDQGTFRPAEEYPESGVSFALLPALNADRLRVAALRGPVGDSATACAR